MESNKYTVINQCIDGVVVMGYTVESPNGTTKTLKKEDAVKLARADKLNNAKAILDIDGQYIMRVENDIETVFRNPELKLSLLCRIMEDNKCVGYKARDNSGKTYRLSTNKTWELAVNNTVHGVKARINNGKKVITDCGSGLLNSLPKITD